ncbi:MAG: deaminase, partial [Chloroflexota bacterium]
IELLFDCSFSTPTKEENAMFHAHAAALRSASLARQVGAAVTTVDGDLVAVGTNEVPKAKGGLYWQGDDPDWRDFKWGHDTSDVGRKDLLVDILDRLRKSSMLAGIESEDDVENLVNRTLAGEKTPLAGTKLMDLIEFVRAVHAEMAALLAAARLGTSVRGCTLYTTTFPCHDCAKHIVAAGILRVVYIHPYPKSRALAMHKDSIVMGRAAEAGKAVTFESFVGIAPRKYMDLFTHTGGRKDKQGRPITVDWSRARPRLGESPTSLEARRTAEDVEFKRFKDLLEERKLLWVPKEDNGEGDNA